MKGRTRHGSALFLALLLGLVPAVLAASDASVPPTPSNTPAVNQNQDPLLKILVSKGVITPEEAKFVGAGTAENQREKLIYLLKQKGLLDTADVNALNTTAPAPSSQAAAVPVANTSTGSAKLRPAVLSTTTAVIDPQAAAAPAKPAGPKVVPAVAPIRVLQTEATKKDGMIPDIKLGSGARLKLYGFLKASAVYDSSSPYGNDFPLPGFIGSIDTGPNHGSEFHIKARAARFGSNFEWPDASERMAITGRVEFDWEGNFSRAANRNISSIRSNMASLRLAWARVDYKTSDNTSIYGVFGQDWTPFGSSTLPNLLETTGLGISFGTLYERNPQVRFGLSHNFGGSRKFIMAPEFAVVLPSSGNPPTLIDNQLAYGERQGPDSAQPEYQGRLVTQWVLDPASGVAPAQFIISMMKGQRQVEANGAAVAASSLTAAQKAIFAKGVNVSSDQWGATAELQLPTRFVTVTTKYYTGADLRYFFAGGLYSTFNNTNGLVSGTIQSVTTLDGSTVLIGNNAAGQTVIAPQRPVRAQGGFLNLGFPLGRIFHADPAGRNAGWQLYLHAGTDQPYASDVRNVGRSVSGATFNLAQNARDRSDLGAVTLLWKFNPFVTFGIEESQYRTTMSGGQAFGAVLNGRPTWAGYPAMAWHDNRSEFATIFTF